MGIRHALHHRLSRVEWSAAVRAWLILFNCGLGAVWAQSATDGAIGGRVLSAAGDPVAGARVVVRDLETFLS